MNISDLRLLVVAATKKAPNNEITTTPFPLFGDPSKSREVPLVYYSELIKSVLYFHQAVANYKPENLSYLVVTARTYLADLYTAFINQVALQSIQLPEAVAKVIEAEIADIFKENMRRRLSDKLDTYLSTLLIPTIIRYRNVGGKVTMQERVYDVLDFMKHNKGLIYLPDGTFNPQIYSVKPDETVLYDIYKGSIPTWDAGDKLLRRVKKEVLESREFPEARKIFIQEIEKMEEGAQKKVEIKQSTFKKYKRKQLEEIFGIKDIPISHEYRTNPENGEILGQGAQFLFWYKAIKSTPYFQIPPESYEIIRSLEDQEWFEAVEANIEQVTVKKQRALALRTGESPYPDRPARTRSARAWREAMRKYSNRHSQERNMWQI